MFGLRLYAELGGWLLLLAALEYWGGHVGADSVDLLITACLGAVVVATQRFTHWPRFFLSCAVRAAERVSHWLDGTFGLDFYPEANPHLERYRRPVWVMVALTALVGSTAAVLALAGAPLTAILRHSYATYLLASLVVWLALWQCVWVVTLALAREFDRRGERPTTRRARMPLVGMAAAVCLACLMLLDATVGPLGWLACYAVTCLLLLPRRWGPPLDFEMHVRVRRGGRFVLQQATTEGLMRSQRAIAALSGLALALVTQGHRLPFAHGDPEATIQRLPMLDTVGRAATWAIATLVLAWTVLYVVDMTWGRRQNDPATRGPYLRDRARLLDLLRSHLELARQSPRPTGDGYLLAPHWWPAERLVRDDSGLTDTEAGAPAGPRYNAHYSLAGRRTLRAALRAAEIDVVFIEDGVPAERLARAFRALFARLDTDAGRLEDRQLSELGASPVALQELQPQPEPVAPEQAEELVPGRARLLLLLRERSGGSEEPDPFDFAHDPHWVEEFLQGTTLPSGVVA